MMIPHDKRSESPQKPEVTRKKDRESVPNDKNEEWLSALERELQDMEKKWPGAQNSR